MILRHDGALTVALAELDFPGEPLDTLSLAGPRPVSSALVGHRPVLHCDSGASVLPLPEHAYPVWQLEESLALKAVGA